MEKATIITKGYSLIAKPIINKVISLQSFFFGRPRLDVDLIIDPANMYGQKSLGVSADQESNSVPIDRVKYDLEFHWHYILRIKNNSSKTAYGLKIEKIYLRYGDYLSPLDNLISLKEGGEYQLQYVLRHTASMNGSQAQRFLKEFPGHIDQMEVVLSYTNEARTRFYTKFTYTDQKKQNDHLLRKPAQIK